MVAKPESVLVPPPTRPHVSVARLAAHWYVACRSKRLKSKPLKRTILGMPTVIFRGENGPAALLDRCPHRNVPLSDGDVVSGTLQCPYHGWRFDGGGVCVAVPGLCGDAHAKGRDAVSFPVREQDGFVWMWCDPAVEPTTEPPDVLAGAREGYSQICAELVFECTLHAAAENALDVPHTAFLHGGLFRTSDKKNRITCRVQRAADRVECEYIGEPRPEGLIGRLLAPGGGVVTHFDRFILPCMAQVEYKLGEKSHLIATQFLTPEEDFRTRAYAMVNFRLPLPHWLVRLAVEPVARRILKQDAVVLRAQTENIHRFGGERYVSSDVDVLGPHIWHLLKHAESGDVRPSEREVREVEMLV